MAKASKMAMLEPNAKSLREDCHSSNTHTQNASAMMTKLYDLNRKLRHKLDDKEAKLSSLKDQSKIQKTQNLGY